MAKSMASVQNVDEQNLLKNKSEKRDVIKRNIDTIIDHSKNGIDGDSLIKIMELMLHGSESSEKIDVNKIRREIKKELKIEIKKEILDELNSTKNGLVKTNELNKEEFLSFFIQDLKKINDINKIERHMKILMNQDVLETWISGTLPNLKIYLDEFISCEPRLEKNAYKVNQKIIKYNFSFQDKKQIIDWISEVKKSVI